MVPVVSWARSTAAAGRNVARKAIAIRPRITGWLVSRVMADATSRPGRAAGSLLPGAVHSGWRLSSVPAPLRPDRHAAGTPSPDRGGPPRDRANRRWRLQRAANRWHCAPLPRGVATLRATAGCDEHTAPAPLRLSGQ